MLAVALLLLLLAAALRAALRLPAGWLWALQLGLVVVGSGIFALCTIEAQSDAQGAIVWMAGLPVLTVMSLAALVAAWRVARAGLRLRQLAMHGLALTWVAAWMLGVFYRPAQFTLSAWAASAYEAVTGLTPWEAGHGAKHHAPAVGDRVSWAPPQPGSTRKVRRPPAAYQLEVTLRPGAGDALDVEAPAPVSQGCAATELPPSQAGGSPVLLTLKNESYELLQVIWVDYEGRRTGLHGLVPPRGTHRQDGDTGQVWLLRSGENGHCRAVISVPRAAAAAATPEASPPAPSTAP